MTDAQTRRHAAQAARSGDPHDEARVLRERLRVAPVCASCGGNGRSTRACPDHRPEMLSCGPSCEVWGVCPACAGTGSPFAARLELAAYCGSEAAQVCLKPEMSGYNPWCSCDLPGPGRGFHSDACEMRPWQFSRWVSGLSRWGPEVQVRAAVAAARSTIDALTCSLCEGDGLAKTGFADPMDPCEWCRGSGSEPNYGVRSASLSPARRAVEAVDAWLASPADEDLRLAAARAFLDARPADAGLARAWLPCPPTRYMAGISPTREGGGWGLERPWSLATGGPEEWNADAPGRAAEVAGEAPVRAAICAVMIAWALADSRDSSGA